MATSIVLTVAKDALLPHDAKSRLWLDEQPIGKVIHMEVKNSRSQKHEGLFFAALKEAMLNWPEGHEYQPQGHNDRTRTEDLRAWILCKAGYRDGVVCHDTDSLSAAIGSAYARGKRPFIVDMPNGDKAVVTAKSMQRKQMGQKLLNEISEAMSEIVKAATGLSLDDYKKEAGKAA